VEHHLILAYRWYDLIASGQKTVEGRPATARVARAQPGDTIVFRRGYTKTTVQKRIKLVCRYPNWGRFCAAHHALATPGLTLEESIITYEAIYPGAEAIAIVL